MASLFPILQEILPMLIPGAVHITKAEELRRPPGLPHHSEDEADPSDQAEEDEEEDENESEENEQAADDDDDLLTNVTGDTGMQAWRSASLARGRLPQSQRPQRPPRQGQPKSKSQRPHPPKTPKTRIANGVSLRDAIVHKSGSLCASILTVKPQCATVVFHNGEQESIVYAVSGTAELATLPDDFDEYDEHENEHERLRTGRTVSEAGSLRSRPEPAKHTIGAGDFAFIPAWTEHQVRNVEEHGGENVVWVVVRNAGEPTVVPLEGWGGEAK